MKGYFFFSKQIKNAFLSAFFLQDCFGFWVYVQYFSSASLAKSRDSPHNKVDSEVVPKVARMTVSGRKQTMGFDVPRYLTHSVLM